LPKHFFPVIHLQSTSVKVCATFGCKFVVQSELAAGMRTSVDTPKETRTDSTGETSQSFEVSVVMPCLNEANSLEICIRKALDAFAKNGIHGEVVVADNGSTDGSIEIAEAAGARVVRVRKGGYGNALLGGIARSKGKFIVMGDADDSYDFSAVPDFVKKWREGYDVVMGNRFQGEIKPGAMPWHHKYIGNPGLSTLLNVLFRTGAGDSHCGMRGFTRAAFDQMDLRTTGMEFASEFIIKASQLGVRITEVPVVLSPDKRGRPPHLRSFHDGWRHLRFMLLYAPNWLFLFPGATLFCVGLFLVFWLLPGPRQITPHVVLDLHTMIFGMFFVLIGAQVISIGFFAKVFSYAERFDRRSLSLRRLLQRVTLEDGLLIGAISFFTGLIGCVSVVWEWAATGFGPLFQVREVLFWSMWLFLGMQAIFSSFFLSMLGISRGTFIGDYDLKK
jgi:glycosyltransferase involved in cell wall biosynthesis